MTLRLRDKVRTRLIPMILASALLAGGVFLVQPKSASAHCDSAVGPVVLGAKKALETGEIKWALAYVKPAAEAEMTAAFNHALEVRKLGGEAKALADRYFEETTVRLHRVGEGADYTGIKENPEITPALEAAEHAVESGDAAEVYALLDDLVTDGVKAYWDRVLHTRATAAEEGTVEALREKAEAELLFEKLIFGIEQAALGLAEGEEGSAAGGHSHGAAGAAEAAKPVQIRIGAQTLHATGIQVHGQTLLPLRAITEAFGGKVLWNGETQTATARVGDADLTVTVGQGSAQIHEGSLMVPGHLLADLLDVELHVDDNIVEFPAR